MSHILEKDTHFFCSSDKGEIWFNSDVDSVRLGTANIIGSAKTKLQWDWQ